MAERWFLRIDGIAGESTDDAHQGEIEVLSWSWGVHNTGGVGGGAGAGAGKAAFVDFSFTAAISKATPQLFLAAATGSHHREAVLTGIRAGGGHGTEFLRYQLTDVTVTRIQHGDGPDSVPTEQFELAYARYEVSYTPVGPSGKTQPVVKAGFDLMKGRKV